MPGWVFTMKVPTGLLWGIWRDCAEMTPSTGSRQGTSPLRFEAENSDRGWNKTPKEGRLRQDGPGCF